MEVIAGLAIVAMALYVAYHAGRMLWPLARAVLYIAIGLFALIVVLAALAAIFDAQAQDWRKRDALLRIDMPSR